MQSANTDTTQHAERAGVRLTWFRTSCICLTVESGRSTEWKEEERTRKEWVEQEKEVSYLVCDIFSEDACGVGHVEKGITQKT